MFNFGKQRKEGPERPRPIDLGEGRPDSLTPGTRLTAPMFNGMPLLARRLDAINGKIPPSLPPARRRRRVRQAAGRTYRTARRAAGNRSPPPPPGCPQPRGGALPQRSTPNAAACNGETWAARPSSSISPPGSPRCSSKRSEPKPEPRWRTGSESPRRHPHPQVGRGDRQTGRRHQGAADPGQRQKDHRSYLAAIDTAEEWARASSLYEWSTDTAKRTASAGPDDPLQRLPGLECAAATGNETRRRGSVRSRCGSGRGTTTRRRPRRRLDA